MHRALAERWRTCPTTSPSCGIDAGRVWTSGHDLAAGVDLLIHDAQYTSDEYDARVGWGHSSVEQAAALGMVFDV